MLNKLIAAAAAITVSLLVSVSAQAGTSEPSAAEQARLVIYRADESSRTRKIRFNASIDGASLGRLSYKKPMVTLVNPGDVELSTSVRGTEELSLSLQPGQTYFVHVRVKKLGQTVTPELVLVEEQVALSQQPAIDGTI